MKIKSKGILRYIFILIVTVILWGVTACSEEKRYDEMAVHYINVGESDCVLIESNHKFMLIDAGDRGDAEEITAYLKKNEVKKLDYIICTHPHADHIGGMEDVVREFEIGKIFMPAKENTTKTFEQLIDAIEEKRLKITKPEVGNRYTLGEADFTILSPNHYNYGDNLNNYSMGIKLTNGKNSYLFIGDNETEGIHDILENHMDLRADVYMCGHHGSDTSTTAELLDAVKPEYAVISVGKNGYGHPGETVLELLQEREIDSYRTDQCGTIVSTSNGETIQFNTDISR